MHHKSDAAHGDEEHDTTHEAHDAIPAGGPDPHDPQDMRNMGGLLSKIPTTAATMIIATLAISGIPLFAGYYSKDQIIWRLWQVTGATPYANWIFWGVGVLTAFITAFYMFRLVVKTFFGPARSEAAKIAKDSSLAMLFPLVVLAFLSCTTGWAFLRYEQFADFLAPSVSTPGYLNPVHDANMEFGLGLGLLIGIVLSIAACIGLYQGGKKAQLQSPEVRANHTILSPGWLYWVVLNKYFVDEAYNFWFVKLGKIFAGELYTGFEEKVIDGFLVNGIGRFTQASASYLRKGQNGFVRSYALSMVIGIVIVLVGCLAGLGRGW